MKPATLPATAAPGPDPDRGGKRIGILIVAYNAVTTIGKVLKRIPPDVWNNVEEVVVFDDASRDLEKVAEDMADEGEGGPEESGPVDHTAQLEALRSRIQAIATTPLPLPPSP